MSCFRGGSTILYVIVETYLALKFKFNPIVGFRNRILISIAIKSWARMERGSHLPIQASYWHFSKFSVLKMSVFAKQSFHIELTFCLID